MHQRASTSFDKEIRCILHGNSKATTVILISVWNKSNADDLRCATLSPALLTLSSLKRLCLSCNCKFDSNFVNCLDVWSNLECLSLSLLAYSKQNSLTPLDILILTRFSQNIYKLRQLRELAVHNVYNLGTAMALNAVKHCAHLKCLYLAECMVEVSICNVI